MTKKNKELKSAGFRIKCSHTLIPHSSGLPDGIAYGSGMTKKGESGRSMVEMLGVLAVIGVLSVAGIAGYSIAMRSYRTNEIVNAASMFYVLAMAQNAGNGPSGTSAVGYSTVGGSDPSGATLAYSPTDKKITITFTDPNDCTMALNKLGDKASANTCSTTPATITVNFGGEETVVETIPEANSECTQEGAYICTDILDTSFTTEPAHKLLFCTFAGGSDLTWNPDIVYCDGTCKDHKVHNSFSEACNGTSVYPG